MKIKYGTVVCKTIYLPAVLSHQTCGPPCKWSFVVHNFLILALVKIYYCQLI